MRRQVNMLLTGTLTVIIAIATATATAAPVARFAVVLGHNQKEGGSGAAGLRYADDDAVATHRLLLQAGVHSVLLTSLDADSRRLHAGLKPHGPPSWAALSQALEGLARRVRAATARGKRTEFLLFYSGHGDVARGEGYVLLADRRLTRTMLHRQVLARIPAARKHVVVDACKSFFLAFARGPGGRRATYSGSFAGRAGPSPDTGFVLSTSTGRDSHEWERFGAGVFSHEVRSALRGAADADGDGRITYAELGAFLRTANGAIPNPRYRPDFLVLPPGHPQGDLSRVVLAWGLPARARALQLDRARVGHVYIEDAAGQRLLDAHPSPGQKVAVQLPARRPLFVRRQDGSAEYLLSTAAGERLSGLRPAPVQVARKGALHLALEQLFATPFGSAAVLDFRRWYQRPRGKHDEPGISQGVDLDGATSPKSVRRTVQTAAGWTALGSAAVGITLHAVALERFGTGQDKDQVQRQQLNSTITRLHTAGIVFNSVALGAGITWLVLRLTRKAPPGGAMVGVMPLAGHGAAVTVRLNDFW